MITQTYGLVGYPVKQSISPIIHNMFYEHYKKDCAYHLFNIEPKNLKNSLEALICLNAKGFNVTIPHKTAIVPLMNALDGFAEEIGAVNTVKIDNGIMTGYNTDGVGFIKSLKTIGFDCHNKKALIMGAGGVVNSIATKLKYEQADITVLARDENKINDYLKSFVKTGNIENYTDYDYDIIINATPVGMYPKINATVAGKFIKGKTAVDLIYNPTETVFLRTAKEQGLTTLNGLWMLIYQAAESFRIWTDIEPDDEVLNSIFEKANEVLKH